MPEFSYVGSELELFSAATHWKEYVRRTITPFIGTNVLEVGAGLGTTTRALCRGTETRWLCLEPDPAMAGRLQETLRNRQPSVRCEVVTGVLDDLPGEDRFDTVLYVDVLEHIRDDKREIERATRRLTPRGHLIVLAPAHQQLFTPYDVAIGHYRRYNRASLAALANSELTEVRSLYLDSAGLLASLGNRLLLRSSMPTRRQLALWDTILVPVSEIVDRIIGYRLGRSVVFVWRRDQGRRS